MGSAHAARLDILRYAQVWEDPRVLRNALKVRAGQTVLSIAAAGDNTLALLLDDPARLIALDFNPVQLNLLRLKCAALAVLDYDALLEFLGVRQSARRIELYRNVRPSLHEDARRYWDASPAMIRAGVIHSGRFERYFAIFRRTVLRLTQSEQTIASLLAAPDLATQREIYDAEWNNRRWQLFFKIFFSKLVLGRLGRDPTFFDYVDDVRIAESLLARTRHGVTDVPIGDNYFVEYILTGNFSGRHTLPPYLQEPNVDLLRERADRLEIVCGDLRQHLIEHPCRYDALNLSDCFEWMSPADSEDVLRAVAASSRSGARVCFWNLLARRGIPPTLRDRIRANTELARQLHERDRTFFYRDVVVGTVYP